MAQIKFYRFDSVFIVTSFKIFKLHDPVYTV
jgi:hypothetical protein